MNQFLGSGLVSTRITEEFRKRAMVSLMATDTLSFVKVSCCSAMENLLIMKSIPEFAPEMDIEARAEMNWPSC